MLSGLFVYAWLGVFSPWLSTAAPAQDAARGGKPAASQPARATRAELEKRLSETLRASQLRGTFRMQTRGTDGKPVLGEAREETYFIDSAVKSDEDYWTITARVVYGEHDVPLPPLRFRMVWADDAAVIVVDEMNFPGLGIYSARVMFHRDYYAGTWFGPDCGGVLSGQIGKAPPRAAN